MMKAMVNRQTHDHHRPHPDTSLSGQILKKQLMHCCGTAPFVFFYMNEKEDYVSQRSLGPLAE